MPHHHIDTTAGTVGVDTTETIPGLLVYELPDGFCDEARDRWYLAHRSTGYALAVFPTQKAATDAAGAVAALTDWTQEMETIASASPSVPAFTSRLETALRDTGGSWPEPCSCHTHETPGVQR